MYLRAAKTEAEEAGEATDGMATSVSELRKDILALTNNKVDIQIDEDTFKSTYQILKELSEVWGELTDLTQANILEMVGGKRNSNVVAALLDNFSVAEEALKTSADSAGSALKENEKVLESIQGRINIMKASFETLSNNVISSDLVKAFVYAGTGMLDLLNGIAKVIDALGGLKTILLTVTSVLLIAKGGLIAYKVQLIAVAAVKKIITFFGSLKEGLLNVLNIIPNAIVAWKAYAAGTVSVSTAMQASIPVIGLVLAAITALVGALSLYNSGADEARQKAKDASDASSELSDEISSLAYKYLELSNAVGRDKNIKDELLSTQDELIKKLSLEKSKIQELTETYGSYADAIKAATVAKLQEQERDIRGGLNEYKKDVIDAADEGFFGTDSISISGSKTNGLFSTSNLTRRQQEELYKGLKALEEAGFISSGSYSSYEGDNGNKYSQGFSFFAGLYDDLSTVDGVLNAYKELGNMLDIISNEIGSDNVLYAAVYEKYNELTESVGAYNDAIGNLNTNLAEQYALNGLVGKDIPTTEKGFETYRNEVIEAAKASGEFIGLSEDIEAAIDNVLSQQSQFAGFYEDIAAGQNQASDSADKSSAKLSDLSESLSKLKDSYAILATAEEEMASGGLSADTIKALADSTSDYLDYLYEENGVVKLNTEAWKEYADKKLSSDISSIDNTLETLKKQEKVLQNIRQLGEEYNSLTNGNVDYNKRPYILPEKMQAAGWNDFDGEIATTFTQGVTIGKGECLYTLDITPILENGTVLSPEALNEYINSLITDDGIGGLLESDKYNIVVNVQEGEYDPTYWESLEDKLSNIKNEHYELVKSAGMVSEQFGTDFSEALTKNSADIESNQKRLKVYSSLFNNMSGYIDAYSSVTKNFTNIASVITSVSNALTTVANLQETVANGFTISLEKALEFAKVYPEILNNATVAADGQITLNEGVVNAFISDKEAELKAQIDAKVAELEADKSVLTAKMEFSKAQLELAKSVGTGEGQISKEVAEYRVNAGNAVAQALIAAGIDEATAYQLACAAMAQNSEEFNRVAAEVCTDVQGNFNQAAYDAAQSIYKNMQNSKLSIASVAEQAHQAALAIAGIGSGKVQGSSSVNGGGAGGSSGSKGNVTVSSGSFKGTSYSYESKTIALEDFISDLELDISNYTQAISQIDGQIAALKALRNTSLNKFSTSNKKASSGSKTSKEKDVDWSEIRIERLQSAIDKLKNVASGAYNTIGEKLGASFKQIEKINEEISIQQEMYRAYMSYANSVGLSESLAEKVREGAIEISKYDSDTRELIESYKKWYEAALDCSDAVTTLHDDLAALYVDIFNNTKQDFEDQISLLEHTQKEYQHELDVIDELSHLGGEKYYKLLQSYEKEHIELLEQELDELQKKFDAAMASGEIEKYSEAWYDSKIAINSVKEAIADANTELIRHTNNLRNASKERFDFAEGRVSQLTQEADFLIGLFDEDGLTDDKGQLTDKGWSVAGLHAQNYDTYMLQADDYAKEMLKVNKELAKDPANTELIERREELLKLQQDSIKSAADEKSAIIDLVKNGIEKELSSLQKLIDTYNESLDSAKNLHDYQKNVTEKAAEIANIQKQMAAYANDSSEEARSKIQKLEVSLKDAREDLQETEYDRYISEQKQLLDDLYAEYEETINSRLDNVDGLLSEIFDAVNGNAGTIDSAIRETAAEFGYTLTAGMAQLWSEGAQGRDVISKYGQEISDKFTALNTVVADLYTLAYEKGDIDRNGSVDVSDARLALRYAVSLETPDAKSLRLADLNGDGVITVGEAREILNKAIGKTYATGGLADYTGLAKVDGSKQKPELVLNQNDTQNFLLLRDYLRKISAKPISIESGLNIQNDIITPIINEMTDVSRIIRDVNIPANMNTIGDINIQIERVQDYNDFITQLQHDPKAERMIQAMTLGQATGKGSLSKYGVSWR